MDVGARHRICRRRDDYVLPVKKFLIAIFAILYFATLLWLTVGVPLVFTSPDENANFTFARSIAAYGDVGIPDSINLALKGVVHPRSTVVIGALTVPGSFLGWPIAVGAIGAIVGVATPSPYGAMLLLTPILVMLALAAWWGIARRVGDGDKKFAWIATALLALHPAFWYYAARGMMHNVPFVCFLIFAAWLLQRKEKSEKRKVAAVIGAGLLIGLALCIRVNEAIWVLPLAILLLWKVRDAARAFHFFLFTFLFCASLPLIGLGAVNAHVYGSPIATGYTVEQSGVAGSLGSGVVETTNYKLQTTYSAVTKVLLPFGFHPRAMLKNVWHYGVALFPWMTLLIIVGAATPSPYGKKAWRTLFWVTLGLAAWLAIVYGSWSFNDNPDPTAVTIGDSHLRYWLPLFVLSTLFAARAFTTALTSHRSQLVALSAVATLSAILVFGGSDGLLHTRQVLFASAEKRDAIIDVTEDDAIIVVDRADKFLFPYRRVIQPLRSDVTYAALPDAVRLAPLYYYGIPFPDVDMTYLNDVKLAGLGLRIDFLMMIGDEALYRISPSL